MNLNQALLKLCLHIGGKEFCLDQFLLANQAGYVSLYGLCLNLLGVGVRHVIYSDDSKTQPEQTLTLKQK